MIVYLNQYHKKVKGKIKIMIIKNKNFKRMELSNSNNSGLISTMVRDGKSISQKIQTNYQDKHKNHQPIK